MVGRSWRNRFPRFFFREGGKKFTKRGEIGGRGGGRGGEGEKTGGSLGEEGRSKFFKTRNKSGSAPYLDGEERGGVRHSRGKERKGETETGEKVTRQSRGIHACETWERGRRRRGRRMEER